MDSTVVVQPNKQMNKMAGEKTMPILHYLPPSPPCRTVLLLGKLLNIDFDLRLIDIVKGEHLKPEYIEINPQHTVPTLEDHGLVLWESRVIITYLTAAYSKDDTLYPRDVRMRALVDQRLSFDLSTLYARLADYYFPVLFRGQELDETKLQRLHEALGFFEAMLKGRTWAAVNNFTLADLSLTVTVAQIESLECDLEPYTRIRTWLQRCKDHLRPYGYDEIQKGSEDLAAFFRSKINS
ncbi:glutathione S-transferase D7-like isoform X2 [Sitodiplosis mosellana]|uniref:glutathione S-transferase D7-like isoform X2 n=1 Tax=Sitodiplosis mosellana TaxID=263140 RepID=UPI002443A47B|nr:glutathione S-transferase D7-like isoform X2 [Sitodiplosis mosellana]